MQHIYKTFVEGITHSIDSVQRTSNNVGPLTSLQMIAWGIIITLNNHLTMDSFENSCGYCMLHYNTKDNYQQSTNHYVSLAYIKKGRINV